MRAARSAGEMKIDVLAVRPGSDCETDLTGCACHAEVLFIQAKHSANIGVEEWNTLLFWAKVAGAKALMAQHAVKPVRVVYTELVLPRVTRQPVTDLVSRPYLFPGEEPFPGGVQHPA